MRRDDSQNALAVKVARLYYYEGLTTAVIAKELALSRPKVSRLLTFARQFGLVEIRILDPQSQPQELERAIQKRLGISAVKVVTVPSNSNEEEWLARVANFTANHLNGLIHPEMIIGIAWGTTLEAISRVLIPKRCSHVAIVQLNGSGNVAAINNFYISEIYSRFAHNFNGQAHLFPVPAFFDYPETKQAMWRERSIRHLHDLSSRADLLVYSIGASDSRIPSYVYVGAYLEPKDFKELRRERVVGDIATVFYRGDGSYENIPLNARASGPDLSLFKRTKHALCVVSGLAKAPGLKAALQGRLMSELIVDEPTAHAILVD
jgi:deoxyribonucleoside regulator